MFTHTHTHTHTHIHTYMYVHTHTHTHTHTFNAMLHACVLHRKSSSRNSLTEVLRFFCSNGREAATTEQHCLNFSSKLHSIIICLTDHFSCGFYLFKGRTPSPEVGVVSEVLGVAQQSWVELWRSEKPRKIVVRASSLAACGEKILHCMGVCTCTFYV